MPYKIAISLLYGYLPGVRPVDEAGMVFLEIKPFVHELRLQHNKLHESLELLSEWGILEIRDRSRTSYLLKLTEPRLWNH
jgi:hypothetical protein